MPPNSDPLSPLPDEEIERALATAEETRRPGPGKVRYTHDAMIDLIITDPAISQGRLAELFGFTQGWVSLVINSDAFQARLEQRKAELVDPTIRASLQERFTAVVARSLVVLQEKLSKDPDKVPDNLALRAAEMGAKALGTGGHAPPPTSTDHLTVLAARLLSLQGGAPAKSLEYVYDENTHPALVPAEEPHAPGPSASPPPPPSGYHTA